MNVLKLTLNLIPRIFPVGTNLPAQKACLKILGVSGSGEQAGDHAKLLARVVCAAVVAGELSLMSALAAQHLVSAFLSMQ